MGDFMEGPIDPEKFSSIKFKMPWLSAIIYFTMPYIRQTKIATPLGLLENKMCGFKGVLCPEKIQLDQIQNYWLLLILICVISGKPCQIPRPQRRIIERESVISLNEAPLKNTTSVQNSRLAVIIDLNHFL